jgi:plastocyanin
MPRIRTLATVVVLSSALSVVGFVAPAGAAKDTPVKLSGKVNKKSVGKAVNGKVTIEAGNFFFDKTFVKAGAGAVKVTLKNKSSAPHTFTVDSQAIDIDLAPGKTKRVTIDVADAAVAFYCRFHGDSGMKGALFTKAGQALEDGGSAGTGGAGFDSSSGYDY